ncbi:tetratricopeptide repeat protein, partial [Amylibacter sp.]|nr:tetratricopeptide repeat protein [Amylibacter sp.]
MAKLTISQALQQGVEAHKAGQVQEAHRLYAAILKVQPKHPDANHNTGLLAVGDGKIELALPFFKTALEANPNIAQFWYSHIVALIKLERLTDAKALLDQVKSKGIKGADFDQLEQRLNEANKVQNPPQNQQQLLIDLYSQGQLQQALEQMKTLFQKFPNSSVLHNICGAIYVGLGELDASVKSYKKAISIEPDYADAYYNMGNAFTDQGKVDEAIEAYNKALSIKPDYADAYYNMGNALKDQGKVDEAIEAYNN